MSSNPARLSSLLPYAAPAARALSALSAAPAGSFMPFVPPTWAQSAEREAQRDVRTEVSREGSAAMATPIEAISALEAAAATETFAATETADDALPWIEAFAVDPDVHAVTDAADDSWAMNEASADIAQLADELSAVSADASADASAGVSSSAPTVAVEPHLPWQEDEAWMDIMPALPHSGGRDIAAETEWARAFGEPPAPMQPPPLPTGDAQAAAASLESIARRLRAGDLNVPGFHAERGDAAALAAALAALLGASE